jgi:hypothetical protein
MLRGPVVAHGARRVGLLLRFRLEMSFGAKLVVTGFRGHA